jgi:hypothetical protein
MIMLLFWVFRNDTMLACWLESYLGIQGNNWFLHDPKPKICLNATQQGKVIGTYLGRYG